MAQPSCARWTSTRDSDPDLSHGVLLAYILLDPQVLLDTVSFCQRLVDAGDSHRFGIEVLLRISFEPLVRPSAASK